MATGKINVSVENIFPLIKKFLYSDHEIFLRELISNATDATLKLKQEAQTTKARKQNELKNAKVEDTETSANNINRNKHRQIRPIIS